MKKIKWFTLIPIFSLVLAGCEGGAEETSDFPTNSIEMIVPYGSGGGTDIIARALVDEAEDRMDADISISNIEGGGGGVGMTEGAEADPDGYTATFITVESTILPHLDLAPFSYEDFDPIMQVAFDPATLSVPENSPFDTIEELMDYAEDNPGEVRIGNVGTGGIWHIAASALEHESGVEFTHVPFDSGAEASAEALGGHVEAVMLSAGEKFDQIEAGELEPIAVMDDERQEAISEVPTFQESGYEVDTIGSWKGIAVPEDTPDEVVDHLSEAFMDAAEDEEFVNFMEDNALQRDILDSSEFADLMEESDAQFEQLLEDIEMEVD